MRFSPAATTAILATTVALIAGLDYISGPEIGFSLFYLVPIVYAGRWLGLRTGIAMAVTAAIGWQAAEVAWRGITLVSLWNGVTRLGIYLGAAILTARTAALNQKLQTLLDAEQRLARTDALTGLGNRRAFLDEVEHTLARVRRHPEPFAIAYIDLDNFKAVNDRYGHSEGDALLRRIAAVMSSSIRGGDHISRIGGDEFAVLVHGCGADALARIGQRLIDQVDAVTTEMKDSAVGVSIGFAHFVSAPRSGDDAIRAADRAMYAAKEGGKHRVVIQEDPALRS